MKGMDCTPTISRSDQFGFGPIIKNVSALVKNEIVDKKWELFRGVFDKNRECFRGVFDKKRE